VPVGPNAITVAGVGFGIGAAALAKAAPRSAFGLLFAAAVADGLDGAVAILRDEVSDTGARLDRLADRVVEAAAAVALWRCGARPALVVAATASTFALEALRAADVGSSRRTITVAERPTRLICGGLGVLSRRSVAPAWTATGCAVVWLASGGIGIVQAVLAGPDPVLRSSGESEPERS
jgi:CDP-diacylglycerol--glycerol-3-phosphate 3-phosphatidyltransferase